MILNSKRLALKASLFFSSLSLCACATYQSKVESARTSLQNNEPAKAAEILEPLAKTQDGDQLVYLLDYATALQIAGRIPESNKAFLAADKLSELQDYHSVSRIAGSLALSQEMVQYKGDTFEKIFINAYLAMNFLELGQLDDALVEARRINEKYQKYRQDEKQAFELNSFSKYLSAMIWEASRSYDDAYIAYEEAYKLDPTIDNIGADLIRSSKLARRPDATKKWQKQFSNVKENPEWYDKSLGELVVLYQQGWGPRKVPNGSMPALRAVFSETQKAKLVIQGQATTNSSLVYDVSSAAIKTLNEDAGILLAKRLAGVATKEVLADQVRQKNELLGAVAWVAMYASDRADLRQWSTLPQTIQTARMNLKPGKYKIQIFGTNSSGGLTGEVLDNREVEIKAGQKSFVVWRSLK
jgi:hypothetical protein